MAIEKNSKLPKKVYGKLDPARTYPYKFYGNAKVHKLSTNDVDDLTLKPIVSNISTATYEMARYLVRFIKIIK